jgi:AmmeMemoRadiSam system protein A
MKLSGEEPGPPDLSVSDQVTLLSLARGAIASHLSGCDPTAPSRLPSSLLVASGVFCTLYQESRLRGCIGYLAADKPLAAAVSEIAISAATLDPRFTPLQFDQLARITIKLSVLSPIFRISPEQIIIGRHGLLIEFQQYRGILLPEVAAAQRWSVNEFLSHLSQKARMPPAFLPQARLSGFTALTFSEPDLTSIRSDQPQLDQQA